MKPKLQVTLDFLHLENALFCAEQSLSAGADVLEIGATFLKNTGSTSLKVLREKFPKLSLVVDMKILGNPVEEIRSVAKVGGNYVTVSGVSSLEIWKKSIETAQKNNIKLILDFRGICFPIPSIPKDLVKEFDMLMMSLPPREKVDYSFLQQASSHFSTPVGVSGIREEENIIEAISMGASTICLSFSDAKEQNIQELVTNVSKILSDAKKTFPEDATLSHEKKVVETLSHLSPNEICEMIAQPCFLEKVYPIQRYNRILGKAKTVRLWPTSEVALLDLLVDLEPQTILVIDAGGQGPATWGHMATELALKKELQGLVIYGSIRDVNRIRDRGLPCYVSSMTPNTDYQKETRMEVDVVLKLGNVQVSPGDWLIADDTGVATIPKEKIFSVIHQAKSFAEEKSRLIRAVESASEKELKKIIKDFKNLYENTSKI